MVRFSRVQVVSTSVAAHDGWGVSIIKVDVDNYQVLLKAATKDVTFEILLYCIFIP